MSFVAARHRLAAAFWVGGVALFTFALTPTLFKTQQRDLAGTSGRLVRIHNGSYDTVPITIVTGQKKVVDVEKLLQRRAPAPEIRIVPAPAAVIMTSEV